MPHSRQDMGSGSTKAEDSQCETSSCSSKHRYQPAVKNPQYRILQVASVTQSLVGQALLTLSIGRQNQASHDSRC